VQAQSLFFSLPIRILIRYVFIVLAVDDLVVVVVVVYNVVVNLSFLLGGYYLCFCCPEKAVAIEVALYCIPCQEWDNVLLCYLQFYPNQYNQ